MTLLPSITQAYAMISDESQKFVGLLGVVTSSSYGATHDESVMYSKVNH